MSTMVRSAPSLLTYLFWPLVILSLLLGGIGIIRKSLLLLYSAAFCSFPMSLYLAATPRFSVFALIFPALFLYSANLLKRKKPVQAVVVQIPFFAVIVFLAFAVLNQ